MPPKVPHAPDATALADDLQPVPPARVLRAVHLIHPVPFELPSTRVLHSKHGTLRIEAGYVIAVYSGKPQRPVHIPITNVAALEYAVE